MAGRQPKLKATINSVVYNLRDWRTVQQGQTLKQEWDQGFARGMGDYLFTGSSERYQEAINLDTTRIPQIRLPPTSASVSIANLDPDLPVYIFLARDANGNEYAYVLNGQFSYKVDLGAMAVDETKDFGANSQCGRPALFENNWYVPLGGTNDFQRLTAVAIPAATDTWDTPSAGDKALAFATGSKDGTAQLARAHSTNNVDLSSNGTDWTGADFEVGDSSVAIVDMHYWQGEYAVVKEDGVWLFDTSGNSFHIEQYTARTISSEAPNDGANSFVHGAYFYWAHRTGLWRFFGQRGSPIGFDADPRWDTPFFDLLPAASPSAFWYSVVAFGRWIYASLGEAIFQGYIQDDGSVRWHGALHLATGTKPVRCFITESQGPSFFYLWIAEGGTLRRMRLESDGSTRDRNRVDRGDISTTSRLRLPILDFGMPDREKQLRRIWFYLVGTWAEAPLQPIVYRDFSLTSENVGSSITAAGFSERAWTPGTNDLAFAFQIGFTIITTGSYVSVEVPSVFRIGVEAATANVYQVVIPLTVEQIASGQSIATEHQNLRNLLNGPRVTIIEPTQGGAADTFNGRIVSYSEEAVESDDQAGEGWVVTLNIQRFDYGS